MAYEHIISADRYAELSPMVTANQTAMRAGPNPRDPATNPLPFPAIGNAEYSACEAYEVVNGSPREVFAYHGSDAWATTWTGDRLGKMYLGAEYRDNFGGRRRPVSCTINGRAYYGFSLGEGMYLKLRQYKRANNYGRGYAD